MRPKARTANLDISQDGNNLTIFDRKKRTSVCIDPVTFHVRNNCDGINSPWEIQRLLRLEHGIVVDEDTVWFALTRLKNLNLLEKTRDDSIDRYLPILETNDLTPDPRRGRLVRAMVGFLGIFTGRRTAFAGQAYSRARF